MIELLKNTLKKDFYRTKYKEVSRAILVKFILFISVLYALLVSPINTYIGHKSFKEFKDGVQKTPPRLQVDYSNSTLKTNIENYFSFNASSNTLLVIDQNAKFQDYDREENIVVFREKGLMVYENGNLIDQETYKNFPPVNFSFSGEKLVKDINSINTSLFLTAAGAVNFIFNLFFALLSISLVSITFGTIDFAAAKLTKKDQTLPQSIKKIIFMCIFLLAGAFINEATLGAVPYADVMLLGIGYLFLNN